MTRPWQADDRCQACGQPMDVYPTYHRKLEGEECQGQYVEHVHWTCSACGYDVVTETWAAQKKRRAAQSDEMRRVMGEGL